LQEQQWALEDQFNDLHKQTYDAGVIADQLTEFVQNFSHLENGERKLLVDSLIERVEIGKNKRVTAVLRPPFAFGYLSPVIAPRGIEPKQQLQIMLEYTLPLRHKLDIKGELVAYTSPTGEKYHIVGYSQQT